MLDDIQTPNLFWIFRLWDSRRSNELSLFIGGAGMSDNFVLSEKRQKELRVYLITKIGLSIGETNKILRAVEFQDREFIKRRNDVIVLYLEGKISVAEMWVRLDKLCGDKLK